MAKRKARRACRVLILGTSSLVVEYFVLVVDDLKGIVSDIIASRSGIGPYYNVASM